ncbi:hypothetical protein [Mycobacteroides abscessus]|uniref:hypothetical protein n=1 Tax=Mycobacteroides abscessus TaxID=36809 RepID=UPI002106AA8B|nr:hypothetical protein [Mycobacteroides abscessus]
MSKQSRRKNIRQNDFTIVARGIRRAEPDYSRLMQATLDHYLAVRRREPTDDPTPPADGDSK